MLYLQYFSIIFVKYLKKTKNGKVQIRRNRSPNSGYVN